MIRHLKAYAIAISTSIIFLWTTISLGLPPEGYETYALSGGAGGVGGSGGQRTKGGGGAQLYMNVGHVNPVWMSDYETFQTYLAWKNDAGNIWTTGGSVTAGNTLNDRDAYFIRYDLTFLGQSIDLKAAHIDYRYIQAGKNTVSMDYNGSFGIIESTQCYIIVGMYYRFTLNKWDAPSFSPVNFNTADKEYYPELELGLKQGIGGGSTLSVDVNNRDVFSAYNGDHLAIDVALTLASGPSLGWRLTSSTRYSSLLTGTADINEQIAMFGLVGNL